MLKTSAALLAIMIPGMALAGGWNLEGKPGSDCYVYVTETTIGRLDFQCNIKNISTSGNRTIYDTNCQTDAPSVEGMTIEVLKTGADTATIRWGDFDTDTYRRCI